MEQPIQILGAILILTAFVAAQRGVMSPRAAVYLWLNLIGGADGHDEMVRDRANFLLSLGKMTWPHMLVRAMLAEQIYRAFAILAGHPYPK